MSVTYLNILNPFTGKLQKVPSITAVGATWGAIVGTLSDQTDLQSALDAKQATLVSGTNIKTVNGSSLLGSGNIVISSSVSWGAITGTLSSQTDLQTVLDGKEPTITAGTTGQYWRGDKSWQTLDKSAVGLGSVENTALSTWAGSTNLTTLGTIVIGVWTGTSIAIANGGTGATTATAAFNALAPTQTGNSGKFLTTDGTNTSWATNASGTVTTVSVVSANGFAGTVANATTTPAITISTSITGILKGNGTAISAASAGTDYEVPLTFSTGLTRTTNTVTVNTSQNIATLSNLTSNGFVKTSGSTGTLSIDTSTYLTANQSITLSGDISGTGTTAITTAIGAGKVTNTMLAGSIAASKLVGTDIATVGTITSGTWTGTTIAIANGGTGQTTATAAINALLPSQTSNSGKYLTTDGTNTSWGTVSGGSAAGSTGYVQFNSAGAFAADANLFWDNTNKFLGIGISSSLKTALHIKANPTTILTNASAQLFIEAAANVNSAKIVMMGYQDSTKGYYTIGVGTSVPNRNFYISNNGDNAGSDNPIFASSEFSSAVGIGYGVNAGTLAGAPIFIGGSTSYTGLVGMGINTPAARLHIVSTTEQLRIGYDTSNYYSTTVSSTGVVTFNAVGSGGSFVFSDNIDLSTVNLVTDATTGTKIGTATTQKLGIWGATPIVQPTTGIAASTFVANTSGTLNDTATWDSYTIGQVVKALRSMGILA